MFHNEQKIEEVRGSYFLKNYTLMGLKRKFSPIPDKTVQQMK